VPVAVSMLRDPERKSRFEPVFETPTAKDCSIPDDLPPAYTPGDSQWGPRPTTPLSTDVAIRGTGDNRALSAVVSSKPVQSLLQQSLHMAVDNLFATGMVQQLMDETLLQAASLETEASGTYTDDGYDLERGIPASKDAKHNRSEGSQEHERGRGRVSRSRLCHKTTSMGVMLGSIWIRHSALKVDDGSDSSQGRVEVVNSFIFYPSSWLTKMGLGYGTEASLTCSPAEGWKFNFAPLRAVPENSLIFDLCRRGEVNAVQLMLDRGDASVKDTSPRGWSPLHVCPPLKQPPPQKKYRDLDANAGKFAAAEGRVELCAALIKAGAEKNALVFEGPTQNAL
jgi:hypothetical protein